MGKGVVTPTMTIPPLAGTLVVVTICGLMIAASVRIVVDAAVRVGLIAGISRWPRSTGKVIASGTKRAFSHKSWLYVPHVVYEYSVDGRTYSSSRVTFATQVLTRRRAHRLAHEYFVGADILVYHHPVRHAEAVLRPGGLGSAFGDLVAGLIPALAGTLTLVAYFE
jgi:hypothetical protein